MKVSQGSCCWLGGVADTPEDHAAIWNDLSVLQKWADKNLMKFNKEKYKVLLYESNYLKH